MSLENVSVDQWKLALFALTLVCVTVLIALGKVPPELIQALLAWLIPSPLAMKSKEAPK